MSRRQELAILREIRRLYQNCPERVAAFTRWRWVATLSAWIVIFVAFLLGSSGMLGATASSAIAALGGILVGLAAWFSASAKQMPLLVRYTTLQNEEIEKRMDELKHR